MSGTSSRNIAFRDRVAIDITDGIAHVQLCREKKRNALDEQMVHALVEVGTFLHKQRDIRAIALSGRGKSFCSGLDLNVLQTADEPTTGSLDLTALVQRTHGYTNLYQHLSCLWRDLPVPVIAAVHGEVFGGGLQIALGADIRYAETNTRFSVMEIRWGLIPDMAGTQLIKGIVRLDRFKEMTYTGNVFSADEAEQMGLVTRVFVDPIGQALETARSIASRNPHAIRACKPLLTACYDTPLTQGLQLEATLQQQLLGSRNQKEAVCAELEQRTPQFLDEG
ncbi:MAG: crotonase/enoyl-CoA hydratase family protein [Pseudomonadota bacterium]